MNIMNHMRNGKRRESMEGGEGKEEKNGE